MITKKSINEKSCQECGSVDIEYCHERHPFSDLPLPPPDDYRQIFVEKAISARCIPYSINAYCRRCGRKHKLIVFGKDERLIGIPNS